MDNALESQDISNKKAPNVISRRDFLKLAGVGVGAVVALNLGLDKSDSIKEKAAQIALDNKLKSGIFRAENFEGLDSIEALKNQVLSKTEKLSGISASGIYLSDGENVGFLSTGEFTDNFPAGSLIKIPLMYQLWLKGQEMGEDYLTPEVAQKILGTSESSRDFIKTLPFAQNAEGGVDGVIKKLLEETGINPTINNKGTLEISLLDYFRFLRQTEFPSVILNAMRQTEEDSSSNYGISSIMRQNYQGSDDIYFKIGLMQDGDELVNSYVMMIGDDIRLAGYAKGKNYAQVHEHMLQVGAALSCYSSEK